MSSMVTFELGVNECMIEGCHSQPLWWVFKNGWGIRVVCTKCRDEMMSLNGWSFGGVA